jgi:hypothetical protein|tara:strand:+ start:332 stop:601 length:270 start_codon:yes stop_codon:yes gene_type:complete
MIKAVDRIGIEQNILLGSYVSSNKSIFAFNFHKCSVPIPTNKNLVSLPVTPLCENELRKENRAEILEPLVKGIIYTERVRKNKSNGVKK